jgi:hypothetical protein
MTIVTRLIALKPCSFGGKKFYIGDEIPEEYVESPSKQEQLGVLKVVNVDSEVTEVTENVVVTDPTLSIVVQSNGEEMILEPTDRGVQDVFNVLIGKAAEAEAIINQMTDGDALILLHLSDSRKSVKEAAEARAKELEGDQ